MFAEFERDILRDRVKAGIAQARKEGGPHGRPPSVTKYIQQVRALARKGLNQSEISRRLRISRTSVRRFLGQHEPKLQDGPLAYEITSIICRLPQKRPSRECSIL